MDQTGADEVRDPDRFVSDTAARALPIGSINYRAFVGPPDEYDIMGATQFALLSAVGLREWDKVLDIGCGSLRLGRLLIPYLEAGNYVGLEPNSWLIEDAVERHLGSELIRLKSPSFYYQDDFDFTSCGSGYDFVIAQSILSHVGGDLLRRIFENVGAILAENGLFLFTLVDEHSVAKGHMEGERSSGWIYPECTLFDSADVEKIAAARNLEVTRLQWFHARQTWYAAYLRGSDLLGLSTIGSRAGVFLTRNPD